MAQQPTKSSSSLASVCCDLQLKPKSTHKDFLTKLNKITGHDDVVCECYLGNKIPKSLISWSVSLTMKLMRQLYDNSKALGPFNVKTKLEEITHEDSYLLVLRKKQTQIITNDENKNIDNNMSANTKTELKSDNNKKSENTSSETVLGGCIGFCSFRIEYEPNWQCNELYIYEIMIDQTYAKQGFGTYLMALCHYIAQNKKCKQLGLTCFSTSKAIKFYEKLGYIPDKFSEQNEAVDISDYRLLMKLI